LVFDAARIDRRLAAAFLRRVAWAAIAIVKARHSGFPDLIRDSSRVSLAPQAWAASGPPGIVKSGRRYDPRPRRLGPGVRIAPGREPMRRGALGRRVH